MKERDEIGLKIASTEFETFMNDAIKYHISNMYLNEHDVEYISNTKNADIIHMGNGLIIEFNNSILYEFRTGFGVCDYHLKLGKLSSFPISENYLSVKDSDIENLKHLIGKNPCWLLPITCHREQTVLMSLEFRNTDKTKFLIVGSHFETLINGKMMHSYDGAWIVTDQIKVEKAKLL